MKKHTRKYAHKHVRTYIIYSLQSIVHPNKCKHGWLFTLPLFSKES